MSFERTFKLFLYMMMLSGLAAVMAGGGAALPAAVLFAFVLIVSWFLDTEKIRRALPAWTPGGLALASVLFSLVDCVWFSRPLPVSLIHLLMFLAAVVLLTSSSDRDCLWLCLISFGWMAAASVLSADLAFALCLVSFLFAAVGALVLFEMRRSCEHARRRGRISLLLAAHLPTGNSGFFARFPAGKITLLVLGMTGTVLLLSIPLFLVLPRISPGTYRRPHGRTQLVSGFSDEVELGEIGTIKESETVAMKIRLNEPPSKLPLTLKWRGIALDSYDGHSWRRSKKARQEIVAGRSFFKLEAYTRGPGLLFQTVFLEALSTDVIFAANRVLAFSSDLGSLERDAYGGYFTMPHAGARIRYSAVSDITPLDARLIPAEQTPYPAEAGSVCLQVPELDPRIAGLAVQITAAERHPFMKAQALERYLRREYRYSLRLRGPAGSADPLAAFLFEFREGHCEYFATAMAVMLRQIGIPSRLVNGFRVGEYSTLGDMWVVRQSDAHSWVEAYFKPYGWLEFDPTPTEPRPVRTGLARLVSAALDALDVWWWDGVVSYDIWKQSAMVGAASSWANRQLARAETWASAVHRRGLAVASKMQASPLLTTLAGALLALLSAAALARLVRPRWPSTLRRKLDRRLHAHFRPAIILSFYEEALELLEARGFQRGRSQTPLEFARALRDHPAGDALMELTRIYNRARFGGSFTTGDRPRAEALLATLRALLS
ncbi:MAG: DUF3488 domain-containing protein [Acidobacteria bacterium]|nr:DUF3488 domain-containing protein [Acidobacteriota bacterium]